MRLIRGNSLLFIIDFEYKETYQVFKNLIGLFKQKKLWPTREHHSNPTGFTTSITTVMLKITSFERKKIIIISSSDMPITYIR
jgi:hypothetical protein